MTHVRELVPPPHCGACGECARIQGFRAAATSPLLPNRRRTSSLLVSSWTQTQHVTSAVTTMSTGTPSSGGHGTQCRIFSRRSHPRRWPRFRRKRCVGGPATLATTMFRRLRAMNTGRCPRCETTMLSIVSRPRLGYRRRLLHLSRSKERSGSRTKEVRSETSLYAVEITSENMQHGSLT